MNNTNKKAKRVLKNIEFESSDTGSRTRDAYVACDQGYPKRDAADRRQANGAVYC